MKGHVYCWKHHPCINYYNIFRVYIGMRTYLYELKGAHIANFKVDLFSSSVRSLYCSISNVNTYQCSCKQFMQSVTLLLILVDTGLQELYLPFLVTGIHCTMWLGVKRHIMPVDLSQSVSISGDEINLTVGAVSTGVLCCIWLIVTLCWRWAFQNIVLKWQDFCCGLEHTV